MTTNPQSINAKIDQLRIFVDRLKTLGHAFSAICNQKSWLTDECNTPQLHLHGYQMIPQGRSCSTKGGLLFICMNFMNILCSIGWCVSANAVLHHSLIV